MSATVVVRCITAGGDSDSWQDQRKQNLAKYAAFRFWGQNIADPEWKMLNGELTHLLCAHLLIAAPFRR